MKTKPFFLSLIIVAASVGTAAADFVGSGAGFAIPDLGSNSSSIAVALPGNETINEVSVILEGANHTWVGDLIVTLSGPAGSIDLMNRTGRVGAGAGDSSTLGGAGFYVFADGGANWWNAAAATPFQVPIPVGVYSPSTVNGAAQSFAATYGGSLTNGLWTLTISDNALGNIGSISGWTLSISSTPIIPEPSTLGLLGLAGIGLTFRRRNR